MLDMDGVLTDTTSEIIPILNKISGKDFGLPNLTEYRFEDVYGIGESEVQASYDLLDWARLPEVDGAGDSARDLTKQGYDFFIVTSRPLALAEASQRWLISHGIPHKGIVFNRNETKGNICRNLECEVAVEDSSDQARLITDAGIPVVLLDYPYNKNIQDVYRAGNWQVAKEYMEHILMKHQEGDKNGI